MGYNRGVSGRISRELNNHNHEKYKGYFGTSSALETVKKLTEIKNNNQGFLLEGFIRAVDKQDISVLVGFYTYINTARTIEKELIAIYTKNGVLIKAHTCHFIDRMIGQHSANDVARKGMRRGVNVDDIKDCLLNGFTKETRQGCQKSISGVCEVVYDKKTGRLIQCNPKKR